MDARRTSVGRSRWAAIGAAVAVALGAGGVLGVRAADPPPPAVFVAVDPVRVLDTRIGGGLPGPFTTGVGRDLQITGTIPVVAPGDVIGSGSPVPAGATAIVANLTAVSPTSIGWVSARTGGSTGAPGTSSINITEVGQIVPNSVTIPLSDSGTVNLWFQGSPGATIHLVLDVVGYDRPASASGTSPWDPIPSGRTVTGTFALDSMGSTVVGDELVVVPLPALAPIGLTNTTVNFAPDIRAATVDDDPTCTGSLVAPTAPPGKVCLYVQFIGNVTNVRGESNPYLPATGFRVWASVNAVVADSAVLGTWAYTAP